MYWQVKFFFGLVVVAVLGGGVYFAWPYLPKFSGDEASVEAAAVAGDTKVTPPSPTKRRPQKLSSKYAAKLKLAKGMLAKDPVKARNLVENILRDTELVEYSDSWRQVAEVLGQINNKILFSTCPSEDKTDYTVRSGDNLTVIARRHGCTVGLVARGNGIDLEKPRIFPNQTLRIYRGNWNLKIVKSEYLMLLYDAERLIKVYNIGIGKENRTPVGRFVIRVGGKQKDPAWTPPGRYVPAGDPDNPLGTRWMALKGTDENTVTLTGYGIHGTTDPTSIGKMSSNGCIRMVNEQVEELYDIVPENIPVVIVE